MDLRLAPPTDVNATNGLPYYPEHLPILGSSQVHAEIMAKCAFRKGDRVRVGVDLDTLKRMQEGHGGWNDNMARVSSSPCLPSLNLTLTSKVQCASGQ